MIDTNEIMQSNPSLYGLRFVDHKNGKPVYSEPTQYAAKKAEQDKAIFEERQKAIFARTRISEGDYVHRLDGTFSRITVHQWPEHVQIGGHEHGSYYLNSNGFCSYSGSCGDILERAKLVDSGDYKRGSCWIFSQNSSGAGRGVYATLLFKVWKEIP